MSRSPFNVLFLDSDNSVRSIMGEALLRHWGRSRFVAYSAGSHPKGEIHPLTFESLVRSHLPTEGLRTKSWSDFTAAGSPELDFVFTVCGEVAKEPAPEWPAHPLLAHWGIDDPSAVEGTKEKQLRAFNTALRELDARIKLLIALPLESLDRFALEKKLGEIGGAPKNE